MGTPIKTPQTKQGQVESKTLGQSRSGGTQAFTDNRPEAIAQRTLQQMMNRDTDAKHSRRDQPKTSSPTLQRTFDKDFSTRLNNLTDLNTALGNLNPAIGPIGLGNFAAPGARLSMLDTVIAANTDGLYDSIPLADVLAFYQADLVAAVNAHVPTYTYDTHGDKHFPGGSRGTKFTAGKGTVNPQLVALIGAEIGRILRDANGTNRTYYFTHAGIPECGVKMLTIQLSYDVGTDTIEYHGYPDNFLGSLVLSRAKGGAAI